MERYAITDEQWERVKHLFPEERPRRRGRHWRSHRLVLSAILWVVCSGAKWRDVPKSYGPWKTVYNRFRRWYREGLWERIWRQLLIDLDVEGKLDWELWCVDSSVIRAHRCAAGVVTTDANEPEDHALGRSQGGFGTKLHLVVTGNGIPLTVTATPGQAHESKEFEHVLSSVPLANLTPDEPTADQSPCSSRKPAAIAGDKGYSAGHIRRWIKKTTSKTSSPHETMKNAIPTSTKPRTVSDTSSRTSSAGSRNAAESPRATRRKLPTFWPSLPSQVFD
jgi:transposase